MNLVHLSFALLEVAIKQENVSRKAEETCVAENSNGKPFDENQNVRNDDSGSCLSIKPVIDSSASGHPEGCWVYDDDKLQRQLELRESKISDLLHKQEGLLQAIKKMATKTLPRD